MTENNDVERGLSYVDSGEYLKAYELLLPYAKNGNAEAQAKIGVLYQLGLGVERNIKEAFSWLQKAAGSGNGEAAHNLGTLYLSCEPDLPIDRGKSKEWYNKAKDLGFIVANEEWYE